MSKRSYLFTVTHFDGGADRVAAAENGGRIGVCLPCAKTYGVTQDNMVANAEFMGGAAIIGAAEDRQTFSF